MHALLSLTLALALGAPPAAPQAGSNPPHEASLDPLAFEDALDFFLRLEDPAVDTQLVDFVDCGGVTIVTAVHTIELATATTTLSYSWAVVYTFPSTIFAHSLVKVHMHAEEMD